MDILGCQVVALSSTGQKLADYSIFNKETKTPSIKTDEDGSGIPIQELVDFKAK